MKKILYIVSLICIVYTSCDKIKDPIQKNNTSIIDTALCPAPDFPFSTPVKRVLLEDFTGHKCGNCPEGHLEGKNLTQQFGDTLIVIGIHAGYFSTVDATGNYTYDFRTPVGDEFHSVFGVFGYPSGMVNRTDFDLSNSSHLTLPAEWKAKIIEEKSKPSEVNLQVINQYKSAEDKVCIHIKTEFLKDMLDTFNLCVLITEDSLIKPQKDYSASPQDILNYAHSHVLRDAVNGSFGQQLISGLIPTGTSTVKSFTYTLNPAWDLSKLSVVAFIYDVSDYRILQVVEQKIQ